MRKKIVRERSGVTCEYPGCTKVAENLHHKIPWKIEKSHDSLISLCREHHEIVHVIGSSFADFEYRQKRKDLIFVY